MWWEQEERRLTALWVAAVSKGVETPSPDQGWKEFNRALAEPFGQFDRTPDGALRRVLGVA